MVGVAMRHLGHGVGLRTDHFARLLEGPVDVDWLEAISENFMVEGGRARAVLEHVRASVPVVLHGVSLGIGSVKPLDQRYLRELRALADAIEPGWVSDHLCWGAFGGHYAHDLLPLPHTPEVVTHVVERIQKVQDALGRQLVLENVSSYVAYRASEMTEWELLSAIANQSGCGLLLDVNNVVVSAANHGFDAVSFVDGLPRSSVKQLHLAGHEDHGTHKLDTHGAAVPDEVWELYGHVLRRFGPIPTLVEWDDDVPSWDRLVEEAAKARSVEQRVCGAERRHA